MKVSIPSDFAAGREVQKQILDDVEQNGFEGQDLFALKLALEEALINAIRHGNKLDPKKNAHVEWEINPNRAEITIEDEGPGFDRKKVPDCTADENLEKPGGRGVLLIEAYTTEAEWTKGGRRLRMVFKKGGK